MCELYLHATRAPTARHPYLAEFLARARTPYDNPDGWGVAFHFGDDAQLFHEAVSASESPLARFVESNPPEVATVVGHIRLASTGEVRLANTQPLSRMVGTKRIIYAHNGSVADFKTSPRGRELAARALGTADSEIAFLDFVDWMGERTLAECAANFPSFARCMSGHGPFNIIITDGEDVLVHSDRRHHTGDPDGVMRSPGLVLQRAEPDSLIISSEPLAEDYEELAQGTCLHIRGSTVVSRFCDSEKAA